MIFQKFLNSRQLCLRTSTLVAYLFDIQCTLRKEQTRNNRRNCGHRAYRRYVISKALDYLVPMQLSFRMLYITFRLDEKNAASLEGHLPYGPFFITALQQSTFLNFTISRCICLLAPFAFVLDHSMYFGMGFPLIGSTWELLVANGRHFWALNRQHFDDDDDNDKGDGDGGGGGGGGGGGWADQLRPPRPFRLYRQAWNCLDAHFNRPSMDSFPALSGRLRVRTVLFSAVVDAAVAGFNFILCKPLLPPPYLPIFQSVPLAQNGCFVFFLF